MERNRVLNYERQRDMKGGSKEWKEGGRGQEKNEGEGEEGRERKLEGKGRQTLSAYAKAGGVC